jgi:tetratricopeptide (TPR) repeat protein
MVTNLHTETLIKVGRNEKCICGSGKKFKKCCLGNVSFTAKKALASLATIEARLRDAMNRILEHDKESVESGVVILKNILEKENLYGDTRANVVLNLCKGYQRLGNHHKALDTLKLLEDKYSDPDPVLILIEFSAAESLAALGYLDEACEIHDKILLTEFKAVPLEKEKRKTKGMYLIEAGKAYGNNGQEGKATKCWVESLSLLEEFKDREIEHYQRVKSNLAFQKLNDDDEVIQEEGVAEAEHYIKQKLLIGDIQGTANNFCNLANYFHKKKRFGRAIAYYRKDLYLSELTGNKRDIATTIGNLACLYIELKQFKKAKDLIWREKQISIELEDLYLKEINEFHKRFLVEEAKKLALEKKPANEKAICLCDDASEVLFIDCCGRADFEPVKMPHILGDISEDQKEIDEELSTLGISASPIDFIFRNTSSSKARRAWSRHHVKDGWLELSELPDMANLHLNSAKEMARLSNENNNISNALSAIILSVCSLEAFINQISYFLTEHKDDAALSSSQLPEALLNDGALAYQKSTSLEIKWQEISGSVSSNDYLKQNSSWNEVKDLIYIRNELVHFKSSGYEQVVPAPRVTPTIYNKIPKKIALLDEPHSWPFRVLNGSLAIWATSITEQLIDDFKMDFQEVRRKNSLH